MRKAMLLLAVFGLVGSLWAADPMVGTWKLNIAKSKYPPGTQAAPKQEMQVVRELDGNQLEYTLTGTRTDGSAISSKGVVPQQGGAYKGSFPEGESVFRTVIDPNSFYITVLQNGKQVEILHVVINKDGKTMTATIKGIDAKGKPFEYLDFWDKQ